MIYTDNVYFIHNKICDDDKLNSFNILDILNTRQKDIDKQVIENIKKFKFSIMYKEHIKCIQNKLVCYKKYMIFICQFKYYDSKTKIIIFPFTTILGLYLGSFCGHILTGRFNDYRRSKFLGTLPANVFIKK
ncbi:hypothetical protein PFLG_00838 [Plasmodium falciparum RAJ116]|uniref:Uncharacterized protein n=1 Tax=Plasmodium falciparum RAJ116 TaxID=580058 RepID=A0A0L0CTJ8_PLAFA|nr:hypothetical protein PFLG_00838 [Plasmodium falciparum RAJ116]